MCCQCVKGTVLCVVADNLAYGLAGFVQSVPGHYVYRFFCYTADQMQLSEVSEAELNMRTKASHDLHVQNVVQGENATHFGVVGEMICLKHFTLE